MKTHTAIMAMIVAFAMIGMTGFAAATTYVTYTGDGEYGMYFTGTGGGIFVGVVDAPYLLDQTYIRYDESVTLMVNGTPISDYNYNYDIDYWGWWIGPYEVNEEANTGYEVTKDADIYDGGRFESVTYTQNPSSLIANTTVIAATDNGATVDMTTESYEYTYLQENGYWIDIGWIAFDVATNRETEVGEVFYTYAVITADGSDYLVAASVDRGFGTEGSSAAIVGDGSATLTSTAEVRDCDLTTEGWWYSDTVYTSMTYQMVDLDAVGSGSAQIYGYTNTDRIMTVDTDMLCDGGSITVDAVLTSGTITQTYNFNTGLSGTSVTVTE